jgi:prepilin-type processing-associated H-X9-DG protein
LFTIFREALCIVQRDLGKNAVGELEDAALRHEEHGRLGCNIVFMDGHAEFATEDRIIGLKWTAE